MPTYNQLADQRYKRLIDTLVYRDLEYKLIVRGNSKKIIYKETEHHFPHIEKLEGGHLIADLKDNFEKVFKANHPDQELYIEPNFQISDFNIPALKSNIGNIISGIDIVDAHWFTMYILGYMSKGMFIDGLIKDEYKMARNIAIGCLATQETIYHYKGKTLLRSETEVIEVVKGGKAIYTDIKNFLWDTFKGVKELIGDDYLMFYTDCTFVAGHNGEVIKHLRSKGFLTHGDDYIVDSVNEDERKVRLISVKDQHLYEIAQRKGDVKDLKNGYREYYFKL